MVSPTFWLNYLTRNISIAGWLSKAGPCSTSTGAAGTGWGAVGALLASPSPGGDAVPVSSGGDGGGVSLALTMPLSLPPPSPLYMVCVCPRCAPHGSAPPPPQAAVPAPAQPGEQALAVPGAWHDPAQHPPVPHRRQPLPRLQPVPA